LKFLQGQPIMPNLITMATFDDAVAAALAKNYLESEGIPALLHDESSVATDWLLSNAIGGIKLQVALHHLERAEFLLERISGRNRADNLPHEEAMPEAIAAPDKAAQIRAKQQEMEEEQRAEEIDRMPCNLLVDRLFRATVMGFLFIPLQFYAIWLLLQAFGALDDVDPRRRWKFWVSIFLNIPLMGTALFLLSLLLNR
jgi:hypothetical protein